MDRAFSRVVFQYGIPKAIPQAMLEGFWWDAQNRRYETLDQLEDYCARVASTVGVMMTLLMGPRSAHVLARACDLGLAMQLTNICRDVGEDARAGRLYLPISWLHEARVDPDELLQQPRFSKALGQVVRRLLQTAQTYYQRADLGIRLLPKDSRLSIRAARLIYSDIGRVIQTNRYDSVGSRAHTSLMRKLQLIVNAWPARHWRRMAMPIEPQPAVRFLIDAVDACADSG